MAQIEQYFLKKGESRYKVRYRRPDGRSTDKSGFLLKNEAEAWMARFILDRNAGSFVSE